MAVYIRDVRHVHISRVIDFHGGKHAGTGRIYSLDLPFGGGQNTYGQGHDRCERQETN